MEDLFLIEPNKEYQKSFENYVSAYRKINDDHYLVRVSLLALKKRHDYSFLLSNFRK
jgi:hypothetical protein